MAVLPSYLDASLVEAGCDEAGRGCLAGPVYAAAVILPTDFSHPLINDSKQLSETQRNAARTIIEQHARSWAIAFLEPAEIDELNILRASFTAMHRAIAQLDRSSKGPALFEMMELMGKDFVSERLTKATETFNIMVSPTE